jgi:two-component system chemotaxis response regulator CheB
MTPARCIVVIGASSGGIEATRRVIQDFPEGFLAAVVVVIHVAPTATSVLPRILARAGKLPAAHARDGDRVESGRIYVAPPDRHLIVNGGTLELSAGPRENHHRPAIDVTLRSAALAYRARAVGVILSGSLDDGTAGLHMVKRHGGTTFVQDPADAAYPSMPASAVDVVKPHHVLRLDELGAAVARHVARGGRNGSKPMRTDDDPDLAAHRQGASAIDEPKADEGKATHLACPECKGPLRELADGEVTRFRCHTGHVFSPESLFAGQVEDVERALWTAVRALDESAALTRRLLLRPAADTVMQRYRERLVEAEQGAATIKELLRRHAEPHAAADESAPEPS